MSHSSQLLFYIKLKITMHMHILAFFCVLMFLTYANTHTHTQHLCRQTCRHVLSHIQQAGSLSQLQSLHCRSIDPNVNTESQQHSPWLTCLSLQHRQTQSANAGMSTPACWRTGWKIQKFAGLMSRYNVHAQSYSTFSRDHLNRRKSPLGNKC